MIKITPKKNNAVCNLFVFEDDDLKDSVEKELGWKSRGNFFVYGKEKIRCSVCDKKITLTNLTAFFPDFRKQICDNPKCFLVGIEKYSYPYGISNVKMWLMSMWYWLFDKKFRHFFRFSLFFLLTEDKELFKNELARKIWIDEGRGKL